MKMPGKIIQVTSTPPFEEMPPGVFALNSEGRLYMAYDDRPPEEWRWVEVSLNLGV